MLAAAGGAAGLLLARTGAERRRRRCWPIRCRAPTRSRSTRASLLFVVGASILTGILAGALPALRAGRTDLNDALKEGGRNDSAVGVRTRRAADRLRGRAVARAADGRRRDAAQPDGAAPRRRRVRPAQRADHGRRAAEDALQDAGAEMQRFFDRALERMRALPGVESAALIDDLPSQGGSVQPIVLEGHAELLPRDQPTVAVRKITPGYLRTMRIPLLRGRDVATSDVDVLLVSRAGRQAAVGRRGSDRPPRHAAARVEDR